MSRTTNGGPEAINAGDLIDQMRLYDAMPAAIRRVIADGEFNFDMKDAVYIYDGRRRFGHPDEEIAEYLRAACRHTAEIAHRRDYQVRPE